MQPKPQSSADGFTLLETVVATGILVTALAGIAQLFALAVRSTREAGAQAAALTAAHDKVERLRALAFSYDALGAPVTDPGLATTSAQSLDVDTAGAVDFVSADGGVAGVTAAAGGAVFTRRWRVTPIGHLVPEAIAIEVCVFRSPADGLAPATAHACLATVRVRQP